MNCKLNQMNLTNNIMKSKSAITFYEFQNKMNEHNDFENEWGHFIDIEEHYKYSLNMKESQHQKEEQKEQKRKEKEIYQKKQIEKQIEIFNKKYKIYQDSKDESNAIIVLLKYTFTIIITVNLAYLVYHRVF